MKKRFWLVGLFLAFILMGCEDTTSSYSNPHVNTYSRPTYINAVALVNSYGGALSESSVTHNIKVKVTNQFGSGEWKKGSKTSTGEQYQYIELYDSYSLFDDERNEIWFHGYQQGFWEHRSYGVYYDTILDIIWIDASRL